MVIHTNTQPRLKPSGFTSWPTRWVFLVIWGFWIEKITRSSVLMFLMFNVKSTLLTLAGVVSVLHTDTCVFGCVCVYTSVILTRVVLARWLAPSQTDSSTSALSASQPGCWLRRWGSVRFPWRGRAGGRVSASHRNTGRPPRQESHSSDSTTRHLVGNQVRLKLVTRHRWNKGKDGEKNPHTSPYLTLCQPSRRDHRHLTQDEPFLEVQQVRQVRCRRSHRPEITTVLRVSNTTGDVLLHFIDDEYVCVCWCVCVSPTVILFLIIWGSRVIIVCSIPAQLLCLSVEHCDHIFCNKKV